MTPVTRRERTSPRPDLLTPSAGSGRRCLGQGPVGKSCMQVAAVVFPELGQSRGSSCVEGSWRVIIPMRPISPGTNRISKTTTMMNQRTQRGAPPDTCLDHELVKLDHRPSSCRRATGSSSPGFLLMVESSAAASI